ncbi:MAG: lysophospholipid acyltransferase family protein [Pelobium sp.]
MIRILRKGLRFWYHMMVVLVFVLTYPFVYYYSRKPSRYRKLNSVRKLCSFLPSALSGIYYKCEFETKIDWSKTYIVCPNHSSNLDVFAMSMVMKNNFFFLGKDELLKNPITATYFKTIDIPIKRDSKISAFRAFKKTSERISEGMSPVIFPEGIIGEEYPPILHSFKSGPFRLAIEHKIPIIPVTIKDNWKILWDDGTIYGCKPGVSHICIHKPIPTDHFDLKDDDLLRDLVYQKISSKLDYKL